MLLLRDFFAALPAIGGALLLLPTIAPISAVIFSLSIPVFEEGTCASDLRDLGRAAGRVMSSREDMLIYGSKANSEMRYPNRELKFGVVSYTDIIYNGDV
jgi:hypothetical protein